MGAVALTGINALQLSLEADGCSVGGPMISAKSDGDVHAERSCEIKSPRLSVKVESLVGQGLLPWSLNTTADVTDSQIADVALQSWGPATHEVAKAKRKSISSERQKLGESETDINLSAPKHGPNDATNTGDRTYLRPTVACRCAQTASKLACTAKKCLPSAPRDWSPIQH